MPLIGFIVGLAGTIGLVLNGTGIYQTSQLTTDLRVWGGITAVGWAFFFFTRRARD